MRTKILTLKTWRTTVTSDLDTGTADEVEDRVPEGWLIFHQLRRLIWLWGRGDTTGQVTEVQKKKKKSGEIHWAPDLWRSSLPLHD